MQKRSSLFLVLAATGLLAASAATGHAASVVSADGLVNGGGATSLSFRDMVRPAYWVIRHHHRVWVPNRRHRR